MERPPAPTRRARAGDRRPLERGALQTSSRGRRPWIGGRFSELPSAVGCEREECAAFIRAIDAIPLAIAAGDRWATLLLVASLAVAGGVGAGRCCWLGWDVGMARYPYPY